jgi:hypothetical protein
VTVETGSDVRNPSRLRWQRLGCLLPGVGFLILAVGLCLATLLQIFPQLGIYPDMRVLDQFMGPIASSRCEITITQRHVVATHTDWPTVFARLPAGWSVHSVGLARADTYFLATRERTVPYLGTVHSLIEYRHDVVPAKVFMSNTIQITVPGCDNGR